MEKCHKKLNVAIITKYKVNYKKNNNNCIFDVLSYQTASKFLQEKCKIGYFKLFQDSA